MPFIDLNVAELDKHLSMIEAHGTHLIQMTFFESFYKSRLIRNSSERILESLFQIDFILGADCDQRELLIDRIRSNMNYSDQLKTFIQEVLGTSTIHFFD